MDDAFVDIDNYNDCTVQEGQQNGGKFTVSIPDMGNLCGISDIDDMAS